MAGFACQNNAPLTGIAGRSGQSVADRINGPLRLYLERRLRTPVELVVGHNYVAPGEALRRGELNLA